jgi:hypothetical protein
MSNEAITWALGVKVDRSSAKFVLVAMANLANSDMTCFPSIPYLSDATCQDRKTVIENIKRLKDSGHISDTGARKGATGQVIVYQLNSTENGTIKPIQTVPKTDDNSTVFPIEQSRFSLLTVPKTDSNSTENGTRTPQYTSIHHKDTTRTPAKPEASTPFVLPDWVPVDAWAGYLEMRKKKNKVPTDRARDLVVKELAKMRLAGHDLEAALDNSTKNGWTDVYAPKPAQQARGSPPPQASRHSGFEKIDYSEGIKDGRIC